MSRVLALALCLVCAPAYAKVTTYVLAIGNNDPPPGDTELAPLRYADDDAAAVYSFGREIGAHSTLLAVLDGDSQRRFPGLGENARAPTLAALRDAVVALAAHFAEDRRHGDEPVLIFFFSGHGRQPPGGTASLVLADGELTTSVLYDEVLAKLPAKYVHVIVDACHAEAVLRPRDADAQPVRLSSDDVKQYLGRTTLQRFPYVGALAATTTNAQAHEWDAYQEGIFTHEVLSGLRGAADIDGDGRIEYSELEAFLASANRDVDDVRARIDVVAHAPPIDARAPIVDLNAAPHAARLHGVVAGLGVLHVEDARGQRLVDVRGEPGFRVTLVVPSGELYLHAANREAHIVAQPDRRIELARVAFGAQSLVARGAMEAALARGLFASDFGPSYYRGFVDHNLELVPVPLVLAPVRADLVATVAMRRAAWTLVGTSSALAVLTGVLGGFALAERSDFDSTDLQRQATQHRARFEALEGAAYCTLALGAVSTGVMTWLLLRTSPSFSQTHFAARP